MSAPRGRSGLAPGDCIAILVQLDKYRKREIHAGSLPSNARGDLIDMLDAVRGFMRRDIHVGPMLEGAMDRITACIGEGLLGAIQTHDLRTVRSFLLAVPTTPRAA